MEHRFDLENVLLNGLPEQERRHVVKVMEQVTVEKTRRLQARSVRDDSQLDPGDRDLDGCDEEPRS